MAVIADNLYLQKKKKSSGAYRAVGIASSMIEDKPYVEVV